MTNFIFYVNPEVAVMCRPADAPCHYSLGTAASLTGVHPEMLRYYCDLGLLGPERAEDFPEPTFDDNAIYEVRRIEHCRETHNVPRQALPLLCGLWREVERLETEVRFLRQP